MYDAIIVGSGPAGYTAGIYLSRAGLKNRLITGYSEGGQLTTTTLVENYPGFENGIDGNTLVQTMRRQAEQFGTEMTFGFVQKIEGESSPFKVHLDNGEIIDTKAVIIATGSSAKYLGIEGEEEAVGKGVSACATCDAIFYKEREILVVGGGDVAMEEALYLTRFASKVTVIHRRNELRASDIMAKRAQANDKIHWMLKNHSLFCLKHLSSLYHLINNTFSIFFSCHLSCRTEPEPFSDFHDFLLTTIKLSPLSVPDMIFPQPFAFFDELWIFFQSCF